MKKILLFAAAAAAMFTAGSCQKEIAHLEGDTMVTFEVSTGELATRAIADASNITVLHWELYGADIRTAEAPYGEGTITDNDGDKNFTVNLRLVADQDYNIVFWAETAEGATHYETSDLRSVKIKTYGDEYANDESRAAFFGTHKFHTENGVNVNETITLYRPFSQINLGSTTYETSLNLVNGGKVKVKSSEMTVTSIANSFNTLDGVGESLNGFDGLVTFKAAATPNRADDETQKLLEVNGEYYYWIGMNYLIVEGNSDAIDVDVTLDTNMGTVQHAISNVPVKENYRTNILGDFLTTGATFEIVVDERFEAEYNGNTEGRFETELPEWEYVNGVKTMSLSKDIYLFDGHHLCDMRTSTETYIVDGNGFSVTHIADDPYDTAFDTNDYFSSSNGSKVIIKDITFKGDFNAISAGHYVNGSYNNFNTVFENVNIVDCKTASYSSYIAPAICCYGVAQFNNCNIYGTTISEYDTDGFAPYDIAAVNFSNITFNGGKYGKIYLWSKLYAYVNAGTEIEWVDCCARYVDNKDYRLTVKAGAKVGTVNLRKQFDVKQNYTGRSASLTVEDGAEIETLIIQEYYGEFSRMNIADGTVGKVILHGTEMTLAEFKAAYNL